MTAQDDIVAQQQMVTALNSYWPGAQWSLSGSTYAGLNWLDEVIPKPTEAEVDYAIANPKQPDPASIAPVMVAAASVKISGNTITLQGTPFNIASATRQSTGVYHFAFIKPLPNTNYTAMMTVANALGELASQAVDGFVIHTTKASNDNPFDAKAIDFQIYGQPP